MALGGVFGLSEEQLRPWQRLWSGLLAGMLAQTFVYPLDVVRRRMQTHASATRLYSSTWDALSTIARQEGVVNGLYRGLTLNCALRTPLRLSPRLTRLDTCSCFAMGACGMWRADLKTMPNVAIYMSLYDIVKMRLRSSELFSE